MPRPVHMTENGLPCLDLLEATPGILRALMTELTEADACWKPAPERFSVAEVLARVPVQTLLDYLEAGETIDDFLEGFPTVQRAQVIAFLEAATERLVAATP